jgi:uncharacterized OB-fold protein
VKNTAQYQKQTYRRRLALNLCPSCGRPPEPNKTLCEVCSARKLNYYYKNKETRLQHQKRYIYKLKLKVFNAYGGANCRCCGELRMEFLSIDHIEGDGADHRKVIGRTGIYHWLRRNNYPPGFQVLCMNCNFARGMHGYCPHEMEIGMIEKLGVDETVDEQVMEKAAHEGCPNCGAKVVREGQVLICPNCGTEPFERRKHDVQG